MMKPRSFRQTIAIMVALIASIAIFFQAGVAFAELKAAPKNPDFIKWQAEQLLSDQSRITKRDAAVSGHRVTGITPSPLDFSHLKKADSAANLKTRRAVSFPQKYDLRSLNLLSPVKDQGQLGACWSFATMASMESYLLKKSQSWDFSEKQMAYIAYADGPTGFTMDPGYSILDQGGDMWKATAVLSRWSSPVNETDVPYGDESPFPPAKVQKHVQGALYLPNQTVTPHEQFKAENVKTAVMEYGAVSIGVYMTTDEAYFNDLAYSLYYTGENTSNHEVNIVGWDDSFAKENFVSTPPGDGAWIVRNSWGGDWGDGGYFYLSYYDAAVDDGVAFIVEDADNYDTIYQYDPLGWIQSIGSGPSAIFSNVFTAEADETLKAVSFYVPVNNASYSIAVYTDCQGLPNSGTVAGAPQTGRITVPGYHTISLDNPVALLKDRKFSVVVSLETPGYGFPVPVESVSEGYSDRASSNPGESYISLDSGETWSDITDVAAVTGANVCLKAFTASGTPAPPKDCLAIEDGFSLAVPCLDYAGTAYSITFKSADLINWEAVSFGAGSGNDCIPVAANLDFDVECAGYGGMEFSFTMRYAGGLNWTLDLSTLE